MVPASGVVGVVYIVGVGGDTTLPIRSAVWDSKGDGLGGVSPTIAVSSKS